MIYAEFYHLSTGYIPGTIPPQFDVAHGQKPIPACGSDSVCVIDVRLGMAKRIEVATYECQKRGYIGFTLNAGPSFTASREIRRYQAVNEAVIRGGNLLAYQRLKGQGYRTAWVGEGRICLVRQEVACPTPSSTPDSKPSESQPSGYKSNTSRGATPQSGTRPFRRLQARPNSGVESGSKQPSHNAGSKGVNCEAIQHCQRGKGVATLKRKRALRGSVMRPRDIEAYFPEECR